MQKFKLSPLLLSSFFAFSIGGCQYFNNLFKPVIQRPEFKIEDIRFVGFNFKELSIKVKVQIQNPNKFSLEFSNLFYEVYIDEDTKIAFGEYKEKIILPEQGKTLLVLPLVISHKKTVSYLQKLMFRKGEHFLNFVGRVDLHSSFGSITFDFKDKKKLFSN